MDIHHAQKEQNNRAKTVKIAILSSFAVVLHAMEAFIPTPLPWLRFGFANIITLVGLSLYGLEAGIMITIIRTFIGGFWRGTILGPPFILSIGGGLASTLAMWITLIGFRKVFSPVGLSLIGAITHNIAQLLLAQLLFIKNREVLIAITPVILFIGTITGTVNGFAALLILKRLKTNRNSTI